MRAELDSLNVRYEYEPIKMAYEITHHYTPDFILPNGIVIETKGYFTSEDRTKHLLIKKKYPDVDLRFIFMSPNNKLNSRSKTTYAEWAEKHGFKWYKKIIPLEWLLEPEYEKRVKAIEELRNK